MGAKRALPVGAAGLKQVEGPRDVCLDEDARVIDGAVDMGFGGQMHHVADIVLLNDADYLLAVADIDLFKPVALVTVHRHQVLRMAGIGEGVQIDQKFDFFFLEDVPDEVGADKP